MASSDTPPVQEDRKSLYSPLDDDLDYSEEEEEKGSEMKRRTSSHTRLRLLSEDGEVASDEDGEIKETTPPSRASSEDKSSSAEKRPRTPPTHSRDTITPPKKTQSSNICRHYLQGRCSWGSDCRFLHESPDGGTRDDHSPDSDLPLPTPPLYAVRQGPIPIDHLIPRRAVYDHMTPRQHYAVSLYSHMTWATPPRHRGGVSRPPRSRDKVEESLGWHRLRSITKGWESEEEEEVEEEEEERRKRKGGRRDLRTKLKQKRQSTPSSDSDSDKNSKKRNLKRKRKEDKRINNQVLGHEEWVDPWARKKRKKRESETESSSSHEGERISSKRSNAH